MGPPKPPPGRAGTTPDQPLPPSPAGPAAHRQPPPPRTITLRVPRLRVPGPGSARQGLTKLRGLAARLPFTLVETAQPPADPDRAARRSEAAGRGLARLTVLPALAVAAWLLPGLPLLAAGVFAPVPMLLIAAPLLAALAVNVLHRVPARWPTGLPAPARDRPWAGWVAIAGTVAVAIGFAAWQVALNSPSVLATRAPGVSFQTGYWIAQHGSLHIPGSLWAFGGPHPGLRLSSIGFTQHGQSVLPAVTAGLPMLLAAGFWTSGTGGGAVVAPVLGGLAVLSFGGLAGRLAGRQWAPAGALVLALTLPEIFTSRNAFSEPAVQILLFGGLSLVIDALTSGRKRAAPAAAAAPAPAGADLREHDRPEPVSDETRVDLAASADPGGVEQVGDDADEGGSALTTPLPVIGGPVVAGRPAGFLAGVDARSRQAQDRAVALARRSAASLRQLRWREVPVRAAGVLSQELMLAALGGLCLGLTSLISLTSLVYLVPVIAVAAVLLTARQPAGLAFCAGLVVGTGYGAEPASALSSRRPGRRRFRSARSAWTRPGCCCSRSRSRSCCACPGSGSGCARPSAGRRCAGCPALAGVAVIAALGWLAARPYLQTVRGTVSPGAARYVGMLQRLAGLRVDPTRLYSEDTLYWVIWYAGVATVLLGGFGAAILARRCLRALLSWEDPGGPALNWALPLAVILGGGAAVLWQPFTVPDQPWASRRLVPVVLPGLILLAVWAAAWLTRRARERGAGLVTVVVVATFCVGAMLLPSVSTAFGFGLTHTGTRGGLRPTAGGLAQHSVGAHEADAVRALCASIGRSSSVLIVDARIAAVFTQVIRGMCDVPVASLAPGAGSSELAVVVSGIARAGRHAVLLGSSPARGRRIRRQSHLGAEPGHDPVPACADPAAGGAVAGQVPDLAVRGQPGQRGNLSPR